MGNTGQRSDGIIHHL